MSETECLDGVCPTCDGNATVFLSPDEDDKGHVYCDEDECGWIHRHKPGIRRYVDTGTDQGGDADE